MPLLHVAFNAVASAIAPACRAVYYTNVSRDMFDHMRGRKNYGDSEPQQNDHS